MSEQEISRQNFSAGELSEKTYGRSNLQAFQNGCRRLKNFIVQTQGPAEYRNGINQVHHSRLNQIFNLETFEFNDEQAYALEFTNKKLRFYRNNGIILNANVTITDITEANPGVVTAAAHGYANGDEVFISGVVGMTEVNGKSFLVANQAANTFELTDVDSNNIDTTSFTTYVSGGVSNSVVEIDTPYTEANDLFRFELDQEADIMYIAHTDYLPRVLTRTSDTDWTLVLQDITDSPFKIEKVITNITQANPGVVASTAHGFVAGDVVIIEEVVGMVEINSQPYIVANPNANDFELTDLNGVNLNTTGFTIYGSAGFASNRNLIPRAVALYESRLFYAGVRAAFSKVFASEAPDATTGDTRYDIFTVGTGPADGLQFSINVAGPTKIFWLGKTDRLLLAGTHGGNVKITGADDETAITPTSIKARALDQIGSQAISPLTQEGFVFYVQRGGLTLKSMSFQALQDNFVPKDENLLSDHITQGNGDWSKLSASAALTGVKQLAWQTGRPDVAWAIRNDGLLIGYTFKPDEGIGGWHRHTTGASGEDKFLTLARMPRPTGFDQLWVGVEREVDSKIRRYVGYKGDTPVFPVASDFFTGKDNKVADELKFKLATLEAMKEYNHLDSAIKYSGLDAGLDAGASITPGATSGVNVTFTASAAVFTSADVGREIWKRAINGVGVGRFEIKTVDSPTTVRGDTLLGADFDNTDAMLPGDWYLTTNTISNIDHLEGRTVGLIIDGGTEGDKTVTNGAITLDGQASVVYVGLKYEGFLQPMSLEFGGETGNSTAKPKNIREFGIRFSNTLGAEVGTDLYIPEVVSFAKMPIQIGGPQPLFSGIRRLPYPDSWENDKVAYVRQTNPLPCVVQEFVVFGDTEES